MEKVEKYRKVVDSRIVQAVTGEVKNKVVFAELSNDFIKKVNEISDGNVFFISSGEHVYLDRSQYDYKDAESALRDLIERHIEEEVRKGNFDNIKIDIDTLDLTEFAEKVKEGKAKAEEKKRREEQVHNIKEKIREIVNKRDYFEVDGFYSNFAKIIVRAEVEEGISKRIDELTVFYNDEDIAKLENYDITKALQKYIIQLRRENEELKKKVEMTEEQLIKELYKEGKTITVNDTEEVTRTLRVVEDDYDC